MRYIRKHLDYLNRAKEDHMSLLSEIKAKQLRARKERDSASASALTTLIGDAEMVGKNAGRDTTDSEVMAVVKKFIKNVDETMRLMDEKLPADGKMALIPFAAEKALYESFLPKQLNEAELKEVVALIIAEVGAAGPKDMGKVMKPLKERYDGQFDGSLASVVVKAALA